MKLYFYSGKSSAIAQARWIKTKSAFVGVIIGAIIYISVVMLNRSNGNPLGIHSENIMTENAILRQNVHRTAPLVHNMELQMLHLYERDYTLHQILDRRQIIEDSIQHPKEPTKKINTEVLVPAAASFRP